jgi:uncharacterized protein GlcG (DUF336 family)
MDLTTISLEQAQTVLEAARAHAESIGVPSFITVVDVHGTEKASLRMDGNGEASPRLAPQKARTAVSFKTATHDLGAGVGSDPAVVASITTAGFSLLGGGVPLELNGAVVGAIGSGGGEPDQDVEVAKAGADALQ